MAGSVADYMIHHPVSIQSDTSLKEIMQTMDSSGLSHLLVMDDNLELQGVISKTDILRKTREVMKMTSGKRYSDLKINSIIAHEIMSDNVVTIQSDAPIKDAVDILLQKSFHCLPVMEGDSLVGIVTFYDLLKGYYNIQ